MSAIAGFIHFDGQPTDQSTVKRMQATLTPYGRDAQNHICIGNAAFLRTLLRTTPEDSLDNQPLIHRSSGAVLVFDGRLDNRAELADRLCIDSIALRAMADCHIVMRGLLEKKTGFIEALIGDFSLAFWDRNEQQLHLARDAMGIRPIYWHRHNDSLVFSTMPKGIFAFPGISRSIDHDTVNNLLCLLPQEGNRSFYKGIQRVRPGQHVVLTEKGYHERIFFDVSTPAKVEARSDQEHIEALREITELAVRCRLRADTPISTELSSGKDSSTVTAIAARALAESGQRIQAYTSVPREGFDSSVIKGFHGDEGPGAKAVAAMHHNLDHHLFYLEGRTPLDGLDEFVEAMDRMPLNLSNITWSNGIKKLAASRGSRVLLNGAMGNFTISYDGIYRLPSLLLSGQWRKWAQECKKLTRHQRKPNWRMLLEFSAGPVIPGRVWMWLQRRRGRSWDLSEYSPISPELATEYSRKNSWDLSYRPVRDGRKLMAECLTRMDLGDYYAAYNTFGVEVRSPLVDRRLITLCQTIPESLFLKDGDRCWLLKQAMKGLLPKELLSIRTHGLQAADWFESASQKREQFSQAVKDLDSYPSARQLLDLESMEELTRNWPSSGWDETQTHRAYRLKLLRGLSTGAFIRYVDNKNT